MRPPLSKAERVERDLQIATDALMTEIKAHGYLVRQTEPRLIQLCHLRNGEPFYTVKITRRQARVDEPFRIYYDIGGMFIRSPKLAVAKMSKRIYIP